MAATRPLAVVLPGEPELLTHPLIEDWMSEFYSEVCQLLEELGYQVELDENPTHSPNRSASLWVAHDTGAKRIFRVPKATRWLVLETQAAYEEFPSREAKRFNQAYFQLSAIDRDRLQALAVKDG